MSDLIGVFQRTLEKSNSWLDELRWDLGLTDRHAAYRTLRAVLHVLRDRLPAEEVADLGAEMPMLLRGMYYEGWRPLRRPLRVRHQAHFLDLVDEAYGPTHHFDTISAVAGVLRLLDRHVSQGEIRNVRSVLAGDLQRLWPGGASLDS